MGKDRYRYWLALHHTSDLPASVCKALLDRHEDVKTIFDTDKEALAECGVSSNAIKHIQSPDQGAIDRDLQWVEQEGHNLIAYHDPDYPGLLRELHDPPPLLFAVGRREKINTVQFAIVGSRNPTEAGKRLAVDFASELADHGLTITSGLAFGIDYSSHLGALQAGGDTIAVLGNGLDRVYPSRHRDIAERIIGQGLLVAQFSPGTPPLPYHFPMRNRIISGMSTGVLVVEAARESGSLSTARHALEQGREVFAIPGSIHNPLARGCHALIKSGAKLAENTRDIIEELGPLAVATLERAKARPVKKKEFALDGEYKFLIEKMGFEAVTVNELVSMTGLKTEAVSSMLLILELNGLVESGNGGRYIRV